MTKARALTEEEWLTEDESYVLLRHLRQHCGLSRMHGGRRLLRLYGCGCCRRAEHLFTDERERRVVEVVERAADGRASRRELADAEADAAALLRERDALFRANQSRQGSPGWCEEVTRRMLANAVQAATFNWLSRMVYTPGMSVAAALSHWAARQKPETQGDVQQEEMRAHAALLRDLFGNPFRAPPTVDPAWGERNGGLVGKLARSIYDERRFGDLPVLADALEEAGCSDVEILAHARRPGVHARGCWLIDRLRGVE
jgi:hypothetical protein